MVPKRNKRSGREESGWLGKIWISDNYFQEERSSKSEGIAEAKTIRYIRPRQISCGRHQDDPSLRLLAVLCSGYRYSHDVGRYRCSRYSCSPRSRQYYCMVGIKVSFPWYWLRDRGPLRLYPRTLCCVMDTTIPPISIVTVVSPTNGSEMVWYFRP